MSGPGRSRLPLGRALGELAIVVVGVLIALWADAWFQTREDREIERRNLRAIAEDVDASVEALARSDSLRAQLAGNLRRLHAADADTPLDSLVRWTKLGGFDINGYEPRLTAFRDLESANQFGLLTPEVRRRIAEMEQALGEVVRIEADIQYSQQTNVDPLLIELVPLDYVLDRADSLGLAVDPPAPSVWAGLDEPRLRNAIALKLDLLAISRRYRRALMGTFDSLSAAVDARARELGDPAGGG